MLCLQCIYIYIYTSADTSVPNSAGQKCLFYRFTRLRNKQNIITSLPRSMLLEHSYGMCNHSNKLLTAAATCTGLLCVGKYIGHS
jgi:hypothetical protein